MIEEYTIYSLSEMSVTVNMQKYIDFEGQRYPVEQAWGRSYMNRENDRLLIVEDLPSNLVTAIMSVWGGTPTVVDETV